MTESILVRDIVLDGPSNLLHCILSATNYFDYGNVMGDFERNKEIACMLRDTMARYYSGDERKNILDRHYRLTGKYLPLLSSIFNVDIYVYNSKQDTYYEIESCVTGERDYVIFDYTPNMKWFSPVKTKSGQKLFHRDNKRYRDKKFTLKAIKSLFEWQLLEPLNEVNVSYGYP